MLSGDQGRWRGFFRRPACMVRRLSGRGVGACRFRLPACSKPGAGHLARQGGHLVAVAVAMLSSTPTKWWTVRTSLRSSAARACVPAGVARLWGLMTR